MLSRTDRPTRRPGFTMVELLVVVVIIAILLALLLPVITAAIRTARNASVSAEIQAMGTALTQFKSTYGDYPPSRMYLNESGFYPVGVNTSLATSGTSDITLGQLAQRSLRYLQKFWPRASFSTSTPLYNGTGQWHDFDGDGKFNANGALSGGYIIQGHQCLTFFLGGIPYNTGEGIGMVGFSKNPANPFMHNIAGPSVNYSNTRTVPLFEFKSGRLVVDPNSTYAIPGYYDSIGTLPISPADAKLNFYAYFSSYSGAYDPNDVNFPESDPSTLAGPIGLATNVNFPCTGSNSVSQTCISPAPNPYTSSRALIVANGTTQTAVFQNPNTFQIISPGLDGHYGIGGQWNQQGESNLPYEPNATVIPGGGSDSAIRQLESDNLSNFTNGKLGN